MQFLKGFLRFLFASLFKFSILLLILTAPVMMVFGTSAQIKESLRSSKVYDNVADTVLKSGQEDAKKNLDPSSKDEASPLDNPVVQNAYKKAITPAFSQSTSEQIIDSVYNWLSGKTAQPEFRIDVSTAKQNFIDAVADYAVERTKTLPACTIAQLRQMAAQKVDPLEISCVPLGYNAEIIRTQITEQLDKNGGDFLKNPILTPESLPKNVEGKTTFQEITEKGNEAPTIFRLATMAPLLLGGLAVVSGGALVLLHDDKRRVLRNLAITLLPIGVLGLLSIPVSNAIFSNAVFNKLEQSHSLTNANAMKEPLLAFAHSLNSALNNKLLLFAIAYTLLGVGTLLVLHLTKPKTPTHEKMEETYDSVVSEPATETPVTPVEKTSENPRI